MLPEDLKGWSCGISSDYNDIVPFDINTYKDKFSQILEEVLKLENDKRIKDAILHFDNIGDLTSAKNLSIWKTLRPPVLSISILIVDISKIVNIYRVYLEKSNEQRTTSAA